MTTNPFRQRIGIWYKDSDWRDKMFPLIVSVIPEEATARVHNSKYEKYINLKDGSFIKFMDMCLMQNSIRNFWEVSVVELVLKLRKKNSNK